MKAPLATVLASFAGAVVLLGYFFPGTILDDVSSVLIGWAVVLAGVAGLVGILNLFQVHWNKVFQKRKKDYYSLFFLLAFIFSLIAGLWYTPVDPDYQQVVKSIQVPVESSLLALLTITLLFSALKLFQRRKSVMLWSFFISVVLFLLFGGGMLVNLQDGTLLAGLGNFINRLPLAGTRGILLGVALGSVTTGLRILIGADRPYDG